MSDNRKQMDQGDSHSRPRMGMSVGLWIGLLVPPAIWAIQMQLNYWAIRGACVRGSNVRLYAVTVVSLLIVALSAFTAWSSGTRAQERHKGKDETAASSRGFMLELDLLCCAIFFLAVLAQGIAAALFNPCQL